MYEIENKLMARECGVELLVHCHSPYYKFNDIKYGWEFSIEDPRCREIIREKFNITTQKYFGHTWDSYSNVLDVKEQTGKTIAEAEIA